ncbi:hypothetical protein WA026_018124 [Henosepilachna vigintioctopunctata]|uniref:Uncharacterized protein n=1 Tax=Henosepilachna vigintioctopunctata TaxID=420089 RepID=A0AAW1UFX9_9CUCU
MNCTSGCLIGLFTMACIYLSMANDDEDTTTELNKFCRNRNDCPEFGYWCNRNMTCQCVGLYIPNPAKTKCIGGVGQKCLYDDDCIERAYCEKQTKCKCKKKFHPTDDGLVCVRNEGASWRYPSFLKILAISLLFMKIS